jgi:hypothetical protein
MSSGFQKQKWPAQPEVAYIFGTERDITEIPKPILYCGTSKYMMAVPTSLDVV